MFRRLLVVIFTGVIVGGWAPLFSSGTRTFASTPDLLSNIVINSLPSTASGVHFGLLFNYNEPTIGGVKASESNADYVWGADGKGTNATTNVPGGLNRHDYYVPWPMDVSSTSASWIQSNHPDWLMYKSDQSTLAWYGGSASSAGNRLTLDYTNPAVQQWLEQTYIFPALQGGFSGIAFDDSVLFNVTGAAGHFSVDGNWVAQYSGSESDHMYATANAAALQQLRSAIKSGYPGAVMTLNQGFDCGGNMSDWSLALPSVDMILDEQGFTNYASWPYYTTDSVRKDYGGNVSCASSWLDKMRQYNAMQKNGTGLTLVNQEPYGIAESTTSSDSQARFDLQWNLANYLLIKGNHTYFWWGGKQQYGYPAFTQPEETTAQGIGTPTNDLYPSQSVYMRDYSNGLAIVNPSYTSSLTVVLPAGTYRDLYGAPVSTTTMSAHSGLVLLLAAGASTPTSVPATSAPTSTPTSKPPTSPPTSLPPTSTPTVVPPTSIPSVPSITPTSAGAYRSAVLSDAPVSYYRLDDGMTSTAQDSSGNGHDGAYVGSIQHKVSGATDDGNGAVTLPGTTGSSISYPATGIIRGGSFSLEMWVKLANTRSEQTLFGNANTGMVLEYVSSGVGGATSGRFAFNTNTGDVHSLYSSKQYLEGQWYHVVYTWNASSVTESLYVNGALDSSRQRPVYTPNASGPGNFGVYNNAYPMRLNGSLDEAAIYKTPLSAPQIQNHYLMASALRSPTTPTSTIAPAATSSPVTSSTTNTPTSVPATSVSTMKVSPTATVTPAPTINARTRR